MKFVLTASSISSIAISRTMTFLRLRKIPTMLIANSTAPRIRKCESDSKQHPPLKLVFFLRGHDGAHREREWKVSPEARAQLLEIDVEHHDDEQEQHHHCADIDEHERNGEKLRAQQHPQRRGGEEGEHQE